MPDSGLAKGLELNERSPIHLSHARHVQDLSGGRKVLEDIHLSFYPDAKIGVLGINGAGKSTLLRIMGGLDTEFTGEAWVAEGATVGYLSQEPQLDPDKSVRDNVMEGVAAKKALVDRYNEIAANYSDETADEMAELQDQIDSQNLWDLDSQVDLAMDALRCPPDDADVPRFPAASAAAWRFASCCWSSPNFCCSTSRPTISTPRA